MGQNLEHSVEEPPLGLSREMASRLGGERGGRLMYTNKLEFYVKAVWMRGARAVKQIRRSAETRWHVQISAWGMPWGDVQHWLPEETRSKSILSVSRRSPD